MNDLISRQAAIDAIKRYESADNYDLNNGLILAMNAVEDAPTIDPVKHGTWIEYPIADEMNKCSECGVLRFGESNYCPNCGAKMEGSEE